MRPSEVKLGMVFGKLKTVRFLGTDSHWDRIWECRCRCGEKRNIRAQALTSGRAQSCGCSRITHGQSHARCNSITYASWVNANTRCNNPNAKNWRQYGGANPPVKVCARWRGKNGFAHFRADMGERPSRKYTLGRFADTGSYCKENCSWQTRAEQDRQRKIKRQMQGA